MKVDLYVHWTVAFFDKLTRGLDEEYRDNAILALEKLFNEFGCRVRRKRAKQARNHAWRGNEPSQQVCSDNDIHVLLGQEFI